MFKIFRKKETPKPPPRRDWLQEMLTADGDHGRSGDTAWREAVEKNFKAPKPLIVSFDSAGRRRVFDSAIRPMYPANSVSANPGVGSGMIDWYGGQNFIGYPFCAMLAQNWLVNKCCLVPAIDAVRKGFDITACGNEEVPPENFDRLKRLDKKFKLNKNLIESEYFCRMFGIRIVMFVIRNPGWTDEQRREFYRKPFNIDGVEKGSYRGMSQVDPNYMVPVFDQRAQTDPSDMDYLEPTWWRVSGLYGMEVHKSHLVILRTCDMPDYLKPTYWYGGIPLPQQLYRRIYAAERTADEAPMLTLSKRLLVLTTELGKAIAKPQLMWARLNALAKTRDNASAYAINQDEKLEQLETNLADFDSVMMSQYNLAAAISGILPEKLGLSTLKGFNSTGEYQEAVYHESLESLQEGHLTEIVDRHHLLAIKSEFTEPFGVEIAWAPLDSMTAKEEAEVRLVNSQADKLDWETGAISGGDIRQKRIKDPSSGFDGLTDEGFEDEEEDEPLALGAENTQPTGGREAP